MYTKPAPIDSHTCPSGSQRRPSEPGSEGRIARPRASARSGRERTGAVGLEDPALDALRLGARPFDRTQIVEVPALAARPECPGGERDEHVPVGASPEREAHELHPRQGPLLVEDDLRLAYEALGPAFSLHELDSHSNLRRSVIEAGGESVRRLEASAASRRPGSVCGGG